MKILFHSDLSLITASCQGDALLMARFSSPLINSIVFNAFLTGNMWAVASDGSRWDHLDAIITYPLKPSSSHFSKTLETSD